MPNRDTELFLKLYSKLAACVGLADIQYIDDHAKSLLIINNPGQYIAGGMAPDSNVEDRYALAQKLGIAPQFGFMNRPTESVAAIWNEILTYKQAPLATLSPEQKRKLEDAEITIQQYSDNYYEYMYKYMDIQLVYETANATFVNGGEPVPRAVKLKLKAAYDSWIALGQKVRVETAKAIVKEYAPLEPSRFWTDLQNRFTEYTEQAKKGKFQRIDMFPAYKSWFGDRDWVRFTFDQRDLDNQRLNDAIGIAGNPHANFGIFRIAANGDYNQGTYLNMNETQLQISCELKLVNIERKWLEPAVLATRAWRWQPGSPLQGQVLSTGIHNGIPSSGKMTVLPTTAILCRNLRVNGRLDGNLVATLNGEMAKNSAVGFGPFAIAGGYGIDGRNERIKGTIDTNGIEARDVQLLGFVSDIMPTLPNPNPALPWPA